MLIFGNVEQDKHTGQQDKNVIFLIMIWSFGQLRHSNILNVLKYYIYIYIINRTGAKNKNPFPPCSWTSDIYYKTSGK